MAARGIAALLVLVALLGAALAVALAPPVLGRFVRAAGELKGGRELLAGWGAALVALGAASALLRLARGVVRRAGDPRVARGLRVSVATLLLGALLLEGVARARVGWIGLADPGRRLELLLEPSEWWRVQWSCAPPPAVELHRFHPRLGWEPVPGMRADGITIDALGARSNGDAAAGAPPADARRIVVLGDSFTFGEGVRDRETWVAAMERELERARGAGEAAGGDDDRDGDAALRRAGAHAINLGVMGYGLDQQVLRLEEAGLPLAPDLVVLGLFGPDLDRDELTFRDYCKPRFRIADGELAFDAPVAPPADAPRGLALEEAEARLGLHLPASHSLALLRRAAREALDATLFAPKWELARRLLDRAHAACERAGCRFVLAYFPAKSASFDARPDAYERCIVDWAAARDVELVNVRAAFHELGSRRFKEIWSGHWTPFGNERVGNWIAEAIGRRGLLGR